MSRQYRAYLVGEDGVFRSAEAFEAPSDAAALVFAQQFARQGNVEVWQIDRKIGLLSKAASSAAPCPASHNERSLC